MRHPDFYLICFAAGFLIHGVQAAHRGAGIGLASLPQFDGVHS
jgi:hypothetical protein